ncbi:MAG: hypothetical protein LQ343_001587 [Gyalolechia ehrenbergii]|nr:MAG: hypothetical protein LQ343_001587 [Gyalolechia ehrenbergii]
MYLTAPKIEAATFIFFAGAIIGGAAQTTSSNAVDASHLEGKVLFGYQGFFRRPGQGNDHWMIKYGEVPGPSTPGDVQFDTFPAVEQYPEECLFTTNFILPDNSKARLFESNCTGVVDTHFRWMQENSIDGILVQRFYGQFDDESFLQLLDQIRTAAEKYGRSFAVEYDLSPIQSTDFSNVVPELLDDYANHIAPLMTSSAYLHQDGRPVLELWGFGVDKKKLYAADCATIFHAMRSANPNPYVVLGVQWDWAFDRTQDPDYYNVYLQADVIQPWAVGPYNDPSSYEGFYQRTSISDKALTDQLGIKYAPSITPGGSASNRAGKGEPFGNRYNGTFFEAQLKHMLDLKPFFVFGAMFDEFPESTQVIATLTYDEVPPAANTGFWGLDNGMDHNYYLQLAGRYAVRFHELWQ